MPINKIQMKSINNRIALTFFLLLFTSVITSAQEIIKDSVIAPVKKIKSTGKLKIDGGNSNGGRLYYFRFRY